MFLFPAMLFLCRRSLAVRNQRLVSCWIDEMRSIKDYNRMSEFSSKHFLLTFTGRSIAGNPSQRMHMLVKPFLLP